MIMFFIPVIVPLVPIIVAICVAAGFIVGGIFIVKGKLKRLKGHKLVILGMQGAGKTQLLRQLQNIEYNEYKPTVLKDNFNDFTIEVDGKKYKIKAGYDIPGTEDQVKNFYKQSIKENEVVIFIANGMEYASNNKYEFQTNVRLNFINEVREGKEIILIFSHRDIIDKSPEKEKLFAQIRKKIENQKDITEMTRTTDAVVLQMNLTDKKEVDNFVKKIF